ncbi:hypothetical protein [Bacillus sp. AK128]
MIKAMYSLLVLSAFIVGCENQQQENRMVLLEEKVARVNLSYSNGVGGMNEDIILTFEDRTSIKAFENAILTAVKQGSSIDERQPDFDIMVEYGEGLPAHAIHLWLGEEDEISAFMYMVGERETYITTSKTTNHLRELITQNLRVHP